MAKRKSTDCSLEWYLAPVPGKNKQLVSAWEQERREYDGGFTEMNGRPRTGRNKKDKQLKDKRKTLSHPSVSMSAVYNSPPSTPSKAFTCSSPCTRMRYTAVKLAP